MSTLDRDVERRLAEVQLRVAGVDPLPIEIDKLLRDEEMSSDGDFVVAIDKLRERLTDGSGPMEERATLVRWLVRCDEAVNRLRRNRCVELPPISERPQRVSSICCQAAYKRASFRATRLLTTI